MLNWLNLYFYIRGIHKRRLLKGEGRGVQKCWNLHRKKTTKGREGVIKSEEWPDVVYGWPLKRYSLLKKIQSYVTLYRLTQFFESVEKQP